jgi:hypothetical protein
MAVYHQHLAMLVIKLHLLMVIALGAEPHDLLVDVGGQTPALGVFDLKCVDPACSQALEFAFALRVSTFAQHDAVAPKLKMQAEKVLAHGRKLWPHTLLRDAGSITRILILLWIAASKLKVLS